MRSERTCRKLVEDMEVSFTELLMRNAHLEDKENKKEKYGFKANSEKTKKESDNSVHLLQQICSDYSSNKNAPFCKVQFNVFSES